MDNIFDKVILEKEIQALGMDREYTIHSKEDDWGHTFSSKEIMKLCVDLQIPRKLRILAPQSKYFGKNLSVIREEYWGAWYQVKLCDVGGRIRRYTFPNSKIAISEETLSAFRLACQIGIKPTDYIGRDFSAEDIIFLREFFRVKKIFGGFMLIHSIKANNKHPIPMRRVTNKEARTYLIIDDPIVHLHI